MTAFRLELRRDRALAIWALVIVAAYGAVMGLMYPIMRDNTALLEQYMAVFGDPDLDRPGVALADLDVGPLPHHRGHRRRIFPLGDALLYAIDRRRAGERAS